ncbi:MAG: hypothetical protein WD534_13390 [Phycisphaeraceae bacterium]
MSEQQQGGNESPLQGYFEWQVTTLMLAYDLVDPIPRADEDAASQRRDQISEELGVMVQSLLPQEYLDNPDRDFPPEIMMAITRATLARAAEIAGI